MRRSGEAVMKFEKIEKRPVEERFWEKVEKRGEGECWPWKAGRSGRYGTFQLGRGRPVGAHRMAWALEHRGEGWPGWIRHRCGNPLCCNPEHLREEEVG